MLIQRSVRWLSVGLVGVCGLCCPVLGRAQEAGHGVAAIPTVVRQDGRFGLMVDGAPFLMLGAQMHNSSAWADSMPGVWAAIEAMHANTLEAPVYWETMEPEEGRFDYAQADMLVDQARAHGVRLVLLWFGTWKNGSGHYAPQWLKQDERNYPHVISEKGTAVDSLSPLAPVTLAADKRAFAALMHHLKVKDPERTVIMVQVENETGTWGAVRDHSPAAEKAFGADVPEVVLRSMGAQTHGSWTQVFGDEAGGIFHAYAVAHYVNEVAAAGKAEYALPLYVNAALRDPLHPGKQGSWESGGPTDDVLPLWKAVAPAIDVFAPDIYLGDYARYSKVLDLYGTPTNALMVPETGDTPRFARFCMEAIGHGAMGWAPFGVDKPNGTEPVAGDDRPGAAAADGARQFAYNFAVLQPMDRMIARLNLEGKVKGSAEDQTMPSERLAFGRWTAVVSYGLPRFGMGGAPKGNSPAQGEALVAQLGPNEFLVSGYAARVDFEPAVAGQSKRQFLAVEEGQYKDGVWKRSRIWNGDETDYGLNFSTAPTVLRVSVATY